MTMESQTLTDQKVIIDGDLIAPQDIGFTEALLDLSYVVLKQTPILEHWVRGSSRCASVREPVRALFSF